MPKRITTDMGTGLGVQEKTARGSRGAQKDYAWYKNERARGSKEELPGMCTAYARTGTFPEFLTMLSFHFLLVFDQLSDIFIPNVYCTRHQ